MSGTLLNDSGARRASEVEVCAVPEPGFTDTWHPLSHDKVLTAFENAVQAA